MLMTMMLMMSDDMDHVALPCCHDCHGLGPDSAVGVHDAGHMHQEDASHDDVINSGSMSPSGLNAEGSLSPSFL